MVLNVEGLCVGFGNQTVLKNVSFSINNGEIVAIVGNTGAGKTVTSLAILGLLRWYKGWVNGHIFFDVKNGCVDLTTISEKELIMFRGKQIAAIFQDPSASLNPLLKIGKQLSEVVLHLNPKERKAFVIQNLRAVGLLDAERVYDCYPFMLSGGMCQKVMIAMALLSSPSLLIADEPTAHLDFDSAMQIINTLKDLNKEKKCSILLITHDLITALNVADRIVIMHNGEVVESGVTQDVFRSPKHPYTIRLFNSIY